MSLQAAAAAKCTRSRPGTSGRGGTNTPAAPISEPRVAKDLPTGNPNWHPLNRLLFVLLSGCLFFFWGGEGGKTLFN